MLHRVRAQIRFTKASGLAAWAQGQMANRYTVAVYINEGLANEEPKTNSVDTTTYPTHDVYRCDLPLASESTAADAYATLGAGSVFHPSFVSGFPEDGGGPSWIEHHTCGHDEAAPTECTIVNRKELPE